MKNSEKTEKKLEVNCPHCKKEFNYYKSEFRPFCTEKCKMIDLGHWFDESYTVAGRDNSVYIENPEQLQELMNQNED
jgi:endogenous inhibitor of DNA gyrase (YacG/DUF329 family)